MKPFYLYGIIPSNDKIIFDEVCGMDDDEDEVYTFPFKGLAAVVSTSPLEDYRGLKRDRAMRYLVTHQRVVEEAMAHFTVLPVKFGTVVPDLDSLERLLIQGGPLFQSVLSRLEGTTQMEVVTLWDLQRVFQEIGQEETITRLKAQIAQAPAEQTMDGRVELGRHVKELLEQRRAVIAGRIAPLLRTLTRDSVLNPILDDSVVLNLGLLVDAGGRRDLDVMLGQLDKGFDGQLTFRSVGPLPPYSFATVDVQVPAFEAVEAARELLGCDSEVTIGDIKRAYYQAAKQVHPDLNTGSKESEARMVALSQSYKLLLSVAESQTLVHADLQASEGRACCRLDRAAIEGMLLIAVRRQEVNQQNVAAA